VDSGGGDGAGSFKIKVWVDIAWFKNVIIAGFGQR